jgi:hypothetical protein
MEQSMKSPEQIDAFVREAFKEVSGEFHPCAFFDARLDCIRIIARDCSVLETRINETLTVLEDNYYPESGGKKYVGFTVKGARYFCQRHGLSLSTPISISALLDALLAAFPDQIVELVVDGIARPLVEEEKLERVDVSGATGPILQPV